jgi:hypothetical protein
VCWVAHAPARLKWGGVAVDYRECPWFTWGEEALTPAGADRVLVRGVRRPLHERVMYLVVSLTPEERERLGGEEKLYGAMVEGTRAAMRVFAREIGAQELGWVASARADYPTRA